MGRLPAWRGLLKLQRLWAGPRRFVVSALCVLLANSVACVIAFFKLADHQFEEGMVHVLLKLSATFGLIGALGMVIAVVSATSAYRQNRRVLHAMIRFGFGMAIVALGALAISALLM